jgi:hypothetical protein
MPKIIALSSCEIEYVGGGDDGVSSTIPPCTPDPGDILPGLDLMRRLLGGDPLN